MNINRLILICIVVLTCSFKIQGQDKNNKGILNKLYLKAGLEFSSFNNSNQYSPLTDNAGFSASVMYDYTPRMQFDINYKYAPSMNSTIYSIYNFNGTDQYEFNHVKEFNSHDIALKANYFFNAKKENNPFYLTGGITGAIQSVHEIAEENSSHIDSASHYTSSYKLDFLDNYNRILVGPEVGLGMFLNFGRVNFQSEFTYTARFSPFKDRNYRELSFNLFNGLVYKF